MIPAFRSRSLAFPGGALALLLGFGFCGQPLHCGTLPAVNPPASRLVFNQAKKLRRAALMEHPAPFRAATSAIAAQSETARPSQPARLDDLGWLAGRWIGKWGPRTAEQVWTSPQAGLMLGAFRLFEDDRTLLVELFTLTQTPGGVELRFRHFTPGLLPWEKGRATQLRLASHDSRKWVFLNTRKDQPKRSIIIRVDPDTYTLRSEIFDGHAPLRVVDITFHRQGIAARKSRKK